MKIKKKDIVQNEAVLYVFCNVVGDKIQDVVLRGDDVSPEEELDIDLKINGVELDFLTFVREFDRQIDDMIAAKAKNLVDDMTYDVMEAVRSVLLKRLGKSDL